MAAFDISKSLDQIFTMLTPSDLAGGLTLNLGGPIEEFNGPFKLLASALENDGRGVLSTADLKTLLEAQAIKAESVPDKLKRYFDFYSTRGFLSFTGDDSKTYLAASGVRRLSSIKQIIGKAFPDDPYTNNDVLLMLSRSPFFHPSMRHTRRVEIFLNSMPPTAVAQMVPYLDVEFQTVRDPSDSVQSPGTLKFLLGAADKAGLQVADKALLEGHQTAQDGKEFDFVGMEAFTSPQTMVNPTPNLSVGTDGLRFTDVLDPFRPFASVESVTVTVTPAVGMYTYKKASMVIKLHDRTRLAEISDLFRPQSFSNVTVWLTYGWRAPLHPSPYNDYINNNMLMREAYGIINSNFSFDQVGQVQVTLELFTKGVNEMRTLTIADTLGDANQTMKDVKRLADEISRYRQKLKLDPPEGINKEIRTYQLLDAAQVGEFPSMSTTDVATTINVLKEALKNKGSIDPDAARGLISAMQDLYKGDKTKFSLKERIQTQATAAIRDKFNEMLTGPDPFLLDASKTADKAGSPLVAEISKYKKEPLTKVTDFRSNVVSFGKLFSVFAVQSVLTAAVVDEVQVFFYALNEQCGPVSGHSIAEFPLDMATFLDQYRDHAIRRGGERITLEEFLQLVVNAQVLDNRAIGYGLRSFYEPYDPKNKDAQVVKNKEQQFESALAAQSAANGPFKKPAIEMYIETTHRRATQEGDPTGTDILRALDYSAKDASSLLDKDIQANKLNRIMRIHIYDKQVNPYHEAAQLLKGAFGTSFVEKPSTDYAKQFLATTLADGVFQGLISAVQGIANDADKGRFKFTEFTNARQVKDLVSKMVPTITYGANGTLVTSANLSSKADPLLSTVNMLRSNTVKNSAAPNGSGEGGIPLRVIPASLQMTSLGCPLACMAQRFFIDFGSGTSLDNLYIVTGLTHTLAAGKFETQWVFGYSDAYGVFEGAPNIVNLISGISPTIPGRPGG